MSYPDIFLTRPIRRAIMIFLIIVFLVSAPLIILYTAGYRYDFATKQVRQTGVISIDVEPTDARVYINDIRIKKEIPIRLTNRAPGTYKLKIEKDNYLPWEKDIIVNSKQTTFVKNIKLYKKTEPKLLLEIEKNTLTDYKTSPSGKYILLQKTKQGVETIDLYDIAKNETKTITRLSKQNASKIEWSPFVDTAFIIRESKNLQNITLLDPEKPLELETYTISLDDYKTNYKWSKNSDEQTLYVQENLDIIELKNGDKKKILSLPNRDIVWGLDSKSNIWIYNSEKNSLENLSKNEEHKSIPPFVNPNSIIEISENRNILQSDNRFYTIKKDGHTQTTEASKIVYNKNNDEWLIWSPWELWTVYNDGNTESLIRTGEAMQEISPLDQFGVLFIRKNQELLAFNPGYFISQKLYEGNIKNSSFYQEENKLVFLGQIDEKFGLFAMSI